MSASQNSSDLEMSFWRRLHQQQQTSPRRLCRVCFYPGPGGLKIFHSHCCWTGLMCSLVRGRLPRAALKGQSYMLHNYGAALGEMSFPSMRELWQDFVSQHLVTHLLTGEDGDRVPNAGGQATMQNRRTLLQAGTRDEINIGLAKLANVRGRRSDFPRNKEHEHRLKFKNYFKKTCDNRFRKTKQTVKLLEQHGPSLKSRHQSPQWCWMTLCSLYLVKTLGGVCLNKIMKPWHKFKLEDSLASPASSNQFDSFIAVDPTNQAPAEKDLHPWHLPLSSCAQPTSAPSPPPLSRLFRHPSFTDLHHQSTGSGG
ncbi:uncharacterized protein LOC122819440 [Gambusia affinis]|uniref:uncharacterized protein LOC122819440 n=1 Tax=Gambusia affinis TaxID=33528 RepID=UPI001CDCE34C|nr:uncharacterized protein LOC122819440 [Gambusia affinis]